MYLGDITGALIMCAIIIGVVFFGIGALIF